MKHLLYSFVLSLLFPLCALSQGWPANYGGVMLQGFYWDSYSETSWSNLTAQADELSAYFDLIWVPQSGNCNHKSMGYDPVYWFDHNSSFGSETELRTMISTFKAKGTGIIADVVLNHKNGETSWADFATEYWNGHTISWSMKDICGNDEWFTSDEAKGDREYWWTTLGGVPGKDDEGDNFDGARDLDHTSSNVQQNVKWYLDFLLNDLGYTGFRYDMVKGFAGYYVGKYNYEANPTYSVGEYWDGSYDNVVNNWMKKTGEYNGSYGNPIRSAAFDFPMKFGLINNAFRNSTFTKESFGNKGMAGDNVNGINRYSVTFVDNHDTYRGEGGDDLKNNVLAANAFILAAPGTPCLFWPHWTAYKDELKKMIAARKEAGVTNQSNIIEERENGNAYCMIVQGTKKKIMYVAGYYEDLNTSGYKLVSCGTAANPNYAFYIEDITYNEDIKDITIYCEASEAPYLYVWDESDNKLNGGWPGTKMTEQVTGLDGRKWYTKTFKDQSIIYLIFNKGNGQPQTGNIGPIDGNAYFYYDGNTSYEQMENAQTQDKQYYCYFELPGGDEWAYDIYAWAWDGSGNFYAEWPGTFDDMTFMGYSESKGRVFKWTSSRQPTGIVISDSNKKQTVDITFENGKYYIIGTSTDSEGKYKVSSSRNTGTTYGLFDRTFTAGNRYTVCLPFSLSEKEIQQTGGNFYEFTSVNGVDLQFSSVTSVEAFKPYIFISGTTKQSFAPFITRLAQSGTAQTVTQGSYKFIGHTAASKTLKSTSSTLYYGYSGGQFVKVGSSTGVKILPYRAYFQGPASAQAPQAINIDGETTSISEEIRVKSEEFDSAVYTLDGRRVANSSVSTLHSSLPKGIYIVNGKKVVIK